MGAGDKFDNLKDEKLGQAKEGYGKATGNEELQAEGKGQQAGASIKQAGEKLKDAFK